MPLPGPPEPWAPSQMPAFRSRPPYVVTQMIAAEPALAERLMRRLGTDDSIGALATLVRDTVAAGRALVTTGCGTSEHAAMGIAALLTEGLELGGGNAIRSMPALDALRRPLTDGLLIAVSHEGGTHVTNEALRAARAAGAHTALVTVGAGSPGAEIAELVVRTEEADQSWCHTVGYVSPLLVGVVLAARLKRSRLDAVAVRALLDASADPHAAAAVAGGLTGSDRLIVIGAGPDLISAHELALKVGEGARLPATAIELESVLHGHLAAATRWTGAVLILTTADPFVRDRVARVLDAARTLSLPAAGIVAEDLATQIPADQLPAGRIVLPRVGRVRGVAGSLLGSAMALQLLAERLARARGVNPDTLGREDPAQAAAHA